MTTNNPQPKGHAMIDTELYADGQPPITICNRGDRIRIAVGDVAAHLTLAEARMIGGAITAHAALRPVPDGAA